MRILVIIVSHEFHERDLNNIRTLSDYMKDHNVDYAGITNGNMFPIFESVIPFKYKMINFAGQHSKICGFINHFKNMLNYDWYIKIRPDIKMLEPINFSLLKSAMNARARVYTGTDCIPYGSSISGPGPWQNISIKDLSYGKENEEFVLDDQLYIFDDTVIRNGGFNFEDTGAYQNEWVFTACLTKNGIPLNIIGINLEFTKCGAFSGNIN